MSLVNKIFPFYFVYLLFYLFLEQNHTTHFCFITGQIHRTSEIVKNTSGVVTTLTLEIIRVR